MAYLVVYSLPYEGDEVRYADTEEEACWFAESIQSSYPFDDIGLTIYKTVEEWSLRSLQDRLKNRLKNSS